MRLCADSRLNVIASLEMRYKDGGIERLPLVQHYTLYQVPPENYAEGRRPIALVGRDKNGKVVAETSP